MKHKGYNKRMFKKINLKQTAIITVAVTSGLIVGGLGITKSEAALDWLGLEQKLTNHDEQLTAHDGRITNTEKDVEKLQQDTNTQPSTEKVVIKEVVTENPTLEQTPEPTPVTAVAFEKTPIEGTRNMICKVTYSDGTTREKTVPSNDICDERATGSLKP